MGIEVERKYVEQQMAEIEGIEGLEEQRVAPNEKKMLSTTATKTMFINSIYNWLITTLKKVGNGDYTDMFKIEGSSIICNVSTNYFFRYSVPEGTKIEMKFINKKG